MSAITLKVNGQTHNLDVDPATPLLYVLSDDLALRGPKFGCGLGQCGACTVLADGEAIFSCLTPISVVQGRRITTVEGLGTALTVPTPRNLAYIIRNGIVPPEGERGPWMPAFAGMLTEEQLTDLLNYLRALSGEPAWPDVAREVRNLSRGEQ